MADTEKPTEETAEEPAKSSKLPMILGLIALLVGGGGGFFAASSGMIFGGDSGAKEQGAENSAANALPDVAFVPMDPILVSLTGPARGQTLRFRAQLEVPTRYRGDVEIIMPRVVDVLNGYLRAVENRDIESPSALMRMRAQMLRRVQIVAGEGRVNDLLIMEFVLT